MKAIDLYAYYRALERYFRGNEPSFEVKAINVDSFKNNPDLSRWEKLAGKREAQNYVLANVLENNWTLKEFNDPAYLRWCAVNENMFYNFKSDMETLFTSGPTLNLLKLRLDYKISRESLIILNHINPGVKALDTLWVNHTDEMVRSEANIMKKYEPFVLLRMVYSKKYLAAVKAIASEHK